MLGCWLKMMLMTIDIKLTMIQFSMYTSVGLLGILMSVIYYENGGPTLVIVLAVMVHAMGLHWHMCKQEVRLEGTLKKIELNLSTTNNKKTKDVEINTNINWLQLNQEGSLRDTELLASLPYPDNNLDVQNHIERTDIPTPVEDMMQMNECSVIVPNLVSTPDVDNSPRNKSISQSMSRVSVSTEMSHRQPDGQWKTYSNSSVTQKSIKDNGTVEQELAASQTTDEVCQSEFVETEVKTRIPTEINDVRGSENVSSSDDDINGERRNGKILDDGIGSPNGQSIVNDIEEDGPTASDEGTISSKDGSSSDSVEEGIEQCKTEDGCQETLTKEVNSDLDDVHVKESGYSTIERSLPLLIHSCHDQSLPGPHTSLKGEMKQHLGIDLRLDDILPSYDGLSLRELESDEGYRWNNLPSVSYDDIPEDAFHMVESNGNSNRPIYEELKRTDWVMGYFSQGDSIEVYVNLDGGDPYWYHQQLCYLTGQPESKFRIVDNEHKWSM